MDLFPFFLSFSLNGVPPSCQREAIQVASVECYSDWGVETWEKKKLEEEDTKARDKKVKKMFKVTRRKCQESRDTEVE